MSFWNKKEEPIVKSDPVKPSSVNDNDIVARLNSALGNDVAGEARRIVKDAQKAGQDIQDGYRFLATLGRAFAAIGRACLFIARHVPGPLKAAGRLYKEQIWDRFTYIKDKDGDEVFSKKRASMVVSLTAAFVMACNPFSFTVGPVTVPEGPIPDAILYAATVDKERVNLHMSEQPSENYYTVDGAYTYPSTPEDSVHYRIQDGTFNEMWSWGAKGHPFYPERIKAAVPPVPSWCEVTTYGLRWRAFSRYFNTYPYILDVKCDPGYDPNTGIKELPSDHAKPLSGPAVPARVPTTNRSAVELKGKDGLTVAFLTKDAEDGHYILQPLKRQEPSSVVAKPSVETAELVKS